MIYIGYEPIYDVYCTSRRQYQRFLGMSQWRSWSMSGVVLGGVVMVVGSSLTRGKIFTASIGSVDSLYPSVFIFCMNLHQFLILCSSKAMMFVKLYFRASSTCDGWHLFYKFYKFFSSFIQDLHSTGSPGVPLLKAEYTKKRRRSF